jgi:hypothetical protein
MTKLTVARLASATSLALAARLAAAADAAGTPAPDFTLSSAGIWSTVGLAVGVTVAMWWFKKLSG